MYLCMYVAAKTPTQNAHNERIMIPISSRTISPLLTCSDALPQSFPHVPFTPKASPNPYLVIRS